MNDKDVIDENEMNVDDLQKVEDKENLESKAKKVKRGLKNKVVDWIKKRNTYFYAYIISTGKLTRLNVTKLDNNFFEWRNTKYYVNRNKMINSNVDNLPVIFYKKGVSEPIDTKTDSELIALSEELKTTLKGNAIKKFHSTRLNLSGLRNYVLMATVFSGVAMATSIILVIMLFTGG